MSQSIKQQVVAGAFFLSTTMCLMGATISCSSADKPENKKIGDNIAGAGAALVAMTIASIGITSNNRQSRENNDKENTPNPS
jgi:hypothetical protein